VHSQSENGNVSLLSVEYFQFYFSRQKLILSNILGICTSTSSVKGMVDMMVVVSIIYISMCWSQGVNDVMIHRCFQNSHKNHY
jgi:hypothetical protein